MANFKKPQNKNFVPRDGARKGGPKAGSRSPGHRGYRPAEEGAAPKKQRWNADERAARAEGRPSAGRSERPNWEPRAKGSNWEPRGARTERPAYGDRPQRTERPAYGDRPQRTERPAYGDRAPRGERPAYGDRAERSERPAYGDRPQRSERPAYGDRAPRGERPAYGDRAPRGERPSYGDRPQRVERSERPAYGDRPQRAERPYGDRPQRNERPAYNDRAARTERPSYGDRPARSERPAYNDRPARTERPSYGDRPQRAERGERPAYNDRAPRRDFGTDRAPRRDYDNDRAPRREGSDSKFYPSRDDKAKFTPQDDVVLERLEADAIQAVDVEGVTFADLGLGGNIVNALIELGASSPFPIQAATIPDVIAGKDVLGRGRTGSGKTIAFGAPLVEKLMENGGGKKRQMGRKPRALILAPTRELALQIDRTVQPIARSVGLFTTQIYGGVPQGRQVGALQRGVDIVIGTPGRIEDLIDQGRLDLSEVTITVLDEADHMCDLGFLEPVQRILRETADGGQKLLFSATLDKGVAQLVNEFLPEPSVHEVAGEDQASSTIDHRVLVIEHRDKGAIIEQLADREGKTLVFARTRAFAEQLADQLDDAGIPAVSLHGDLNQSRRTRNLAQLTSGRVNVLVATDVAARGIHVDDIDLVIQADAPDEYKTYLHRSGRTGRAGKQGTVVTLIPKQRRRRMDELLGRAEIEAEFADAIPGDQVITDLANV
ncbi:DEAD/DEAH box helicase [Diaminobutyricibacter tongyongensis]|uniref:DEAD/DEAH box helicase n=1 Tax=Leifsonia tongyongensis TaxID=1268043 RepID=A0A6L9XTZ4_9MICO|nr:DEAD/DEAH box helicase [Diaminobutyricibacter tongyongensis]NEN04833.1 DEAD/DEAH box helicase [Diaminobutyricibacter tongyongensis]